MRNSKPSFAAAQIQERDIACAITDERYHFATDRPTRFLKRENIGQDLTGMLLIGERVDRGDSRKGCELFHILLRKRADDRAMDHPAEDAGGVFDGFSPAKLDVICIQKKRLAAKFAHTDLK